MYIMRSCNRFYGNGIWSYVNRDKPTCPLCGSRLFSHGTCRRKSIEEDCLEIHQLRVLKCRNCKRTHRELPDTLVPYKHYGRKLISAVVAGKAKYSYDESTRYRYIQWVSALILLMVSFLEKPKRELCKVVSDKIRNGNATEPDEVSQWLKLCVSKLVWQENPALLLE